jgi:hypothetical protein
MSTFKVSLGQGLQGDLDTAQTSGVSAQRTIYLPGPNNIMRKLNDGTTFSDSNYWKRYAYPAVARDLAVIETLTDDGTPWDDYDRSKNITSRVANFTVNAATTYAANSLDILATYGGPAIFTQLVVAGDEVNVRLNGDANAIFSAAVGTQIFNVGEVTLNSIAFDNSESGAVNATVQAIFSIAVNMPT